jgi:DNA repair exonuclease SbcCD ATPase subunit
MDLQEQLNSVRAAIRTFKPLIALETALVEIGQAEQRVADENKALAALQEHIAKEKEEASAELQRLAGQAGVVRTAIERQKEIAQEQLDDNLRAYQKQAEALKELFERQKAELQSSVDDLAAEAEARRKEVETLTVQVMKLEQARDDFHKSMAAITAGAVAA